MQRHHKLSLAITAVLGVLTAIGALVWPVATADEGMLLRMGTIVTVEQHKLVIRDDEQEKHTFAVPSTADITLDRRVAEMQDLKPGYFARVSAQWSGEILVALIIEAASEGTED